MAIFLAGQIDWLRAQAAGPDAIDELTAAVRTAERATDRPADRRYAGPCTADVELDGIRLGTCGTDLYALPGRDTITCPTCNTQVPVTERRAWLLEQAEDRLLPVTEMARAVDGLGVPVNRDTIKSWVRRGQLVSRGATGTAVALYRVGDVLDLVRAGARRRGLTSA